MKKNKKFLTLRLWEFSDFDCNYLGNLKWSAPGTYFIEFLALENPCMQNVSVVWGGHITAEYP